MHAGVFRSSSLFVASVIATVLPAQVQWTQRPLLDRTSDPLVFDSARDRAVLLARGATEMETWEWGGAAWQFRPLPVTPGHRRGHALAYDAVRARVVLFGGALTST